LVRGGDLELVELHLALLKILRAYADAAGRPGSSGREFRRSRGGKFTAIAFKAIARTDEPIIAGDDGEGKSR
jgi:hypothetical protein